MSSKNIIYALCETDGEVRYVGKSVSGITRPREHFKPSKYEKQESPLYKWMTSRIRNGMKPRIKILCEVENKEDLVEEEIFMISYLRSLGTRLLNMTAGGEGALGRIISEETRQKMSESQKQKYNDPDQAAIYTAARERAMTSPDWKQKITKGMQKYWSNPEKRLKQSQRRSGCRQYHLERSIQDQHGTQYISISNAAEVTGCPRTSINGILAGRQKSSKGYIFTYLNTKLKE